MERAASKNEPYEPESGAPGDRASDVASSDEPALDEYDKTLADSFPSSDPPAVP